MRILVTAASKYGSTAEIGQRIGEVLTARGHDVSVEPPDGVEITGFDAVVLGSAVYAGHWLPAAKDLVARSAEELATHSTWLFSSGPVGDPPKPTEDPMDIAPILEATKATEHRVFAGAGLTLRHRSTERRRVARTTGADRPDPRNLVDAILR